MAHSIDRRLFLQSGLLTIGGSLLATRSPFAGVPPKGPSHRAIPGRPARRLVVLQLHGGNDGLNTVVPYSQSRYRSLRPTLAVPESSLLPLDDDLAFNPALAPLMPWWEAGRLAVVENVGYPNPDLSHFRSVAIWYTANPEVPAGDGWLGGWMEDTVSPSPLALTTVGTVPSPATAADGFVPAAVADPDSFGFDLVNRVPQDTALREALIHEGFAAWAGGAGPGAEVAATGLAIESIVADVDSMPSEEAPPVTYPEGPLGADLATAARFLGADLPVRVVWVNTGGFDTHAEEAATHTALWENVSACLAAFMEDLGTRGLGSSTAVLVWTEFGRRPAENASLGTDHGTAGPAFLLGEPVKGGLYGSSPDLDRLDANGNLIFDIDFRSIYETVLADLLEVDPRVVLPEPFENLGLFT